MKIDENWGYLNFRKPQYGKTWKSGGRRDRTGFAAKTWDFRFTKNAENFDQTKTGWPW